MGRKSYELGKSFEEDLCWYYFSKGYFVEYHEKGVTGSQSCDITIIKDDIATMVECKNLEAKNGVFNLSRVEENQKLAYARYIECGNTNFILAVLWDNKVYFIDFGIINYFNKSIDLKDIEPNITDWKKVMERVNENYN